MQKAQPFQRSSVSGAPLVIFVATGAEAKPICRALLPARPSSNRSESLVRIAMDTRDLLLARTGMGPQNAEATARRLLHDIPVAAALSVGVAAGLSPQVRSGDLILGDRVIFHRRNGTTPQGFPCDSGLREWARAVLRRSGERHHLGPIATVDRILLAEQEKRSLAMESGAIAADMESAAIASAAATLAVPFLAIRAILDPVDKDLKIAFDQFLDGRGEPRPLPLIRYLVAHPAAVLRLVGLGLQTQAGCTRLGNLLRNLSTLPI